MVKWNRTKSGKAKNAFRKKNRFRKMRGRKENEMKTGIFGRLSDGREVRFYELSNGKITVTLLDYGATVQSVTVFGTDVVLGYEDPVGYERNDGYLGAFIGRVGNRIAGGKFSLGGKEYELFRNDGENTLHGGRRGYNAVLWDSFTEGESVTFHGVSPDGEEGFPGNLTLSVRYSLNDCGFSIEYDATTDRNTPINFTNHTYFNLNGKGSILGHALKLDADAITPTDGALIPTGEIRPVDGTPFDFREGKTIGKDIFADDFCLKAAKGYDVNYVLNGKGFRRFATVYSPESDIRMDAFTDLPGVQFYSGCCLGKFPVKHGNESEQYGAFCLETQFFPDSVHHENFPSCILKAGEKFHSRTRYEFRKGE